MIMCSHTTYYTVFHQKNDYMDRHEVLICFKILLIYYVAIPHKIVVQPARWTLWQYHTNFNTEVKSMLLHMAFSQTGLVYSADSVLLWGSQSELCPLGPIRELFPTGQWVTIKRFCNFHSSDEYESLLSLSNKLFVKGVVILRSGGTSDLAWSEFTVDLCFRNFGYVGCQLYFLGTVGHSEVWFCSILSSHLRP